MKKTLFLALFLVGAGLSRLAAEPFDQRHLLFGKALKSFVHDGFVDYAALKERPHDLEKYLAQTAEVKRSEFETWPSSSQIAFLINVYNANTLKLIIDHYPVDGIKSIGTFFKSPWDEPVVTLFGKPATLNKIEHKMLLSDYVEPRVHFALVCAAKGCPPLRAEPYVSERLDAQLDDQGRKFLSMTEKNRVDMNNRVIHLSPIFHWFEDDFERKSDSVLKFIEPYLPKDQALALSKGDFSIEHTRYDWSLNDGKAAKPPKPARKTH